MESIDNRYTRQTAIPINHIRPSNALRRSTPSSQADCKANLVLSPRDSAADGPTSGGVG